MFTSTAPVPYLIGHGILRKKKTPLGKRTVMLVDEGWRTPRDYESVLSIGSQCLTSLLLKTIDLKRYSGPFDWIFSNLRMVCDCLDDDFEALLDRQYLAPLPPDRRFSPDTSFADHRLFQKRYGLQTIFNHYDPTSAEGFAYLERCVSRFREALASGSRHLLLAVSERHQGGQFAFNRLCDILERHPSVDALVFIVPDQRRSPGLELWQERGRHRLIYLNTLSPVAGVHFEAREDNQFANETIRQMVRLDSVDGSAAETQNMIT